MLSNRTRIQQTATVPQLIEAARDCQRRIRAKVTLRHLALVSDGLDYPLSPAIATVIVFLLGVAIASVHLNAAESGGEQNSIGDPQPITTPAPPVELSPVVVAGTDTDHVQQISPNLGTRIYQLGQDIIDYQGRGPNAGFDEILLHAPGVSRETSGQFHLREEDYGLQYRLNGIQLPDGITSTLGQPFDSRLIQKLTLITGALPAQYGLRNAGVIELQTKTGSDLDGQELSIYGGGHATLHPSFSSGWTNGTTEYFVNGTYLQNDLGTDNVTPSSKAIHDQTRQYQGFALITHEIAPGQKLSLIFSAVDANFQIPNAPGLLPSFSYEGVTTFDSSNLNRNQREQNYYGIIAYQVDKPNFSFQLSEVNSYASTHYTPDYVGDLLFTGVASDAKRDLLGTGVQFDASFYVNQTDTLRTGFTITSQLERSNSTNAVFPTDPQTGNVTSDVPYTLTDSEHKRGSIYGFYIQDEWHPIESFTLNIGERLDFVSAYVHENQFSPRINFTYKICSNVSLHAGYARIFTPPLLEFIEPSVFAQFVNTSNAPDTLKDDVPHSERSHVFDTGASYEIVPGLVIGVDAYYKSVHNMQDETQLEASLIYTPFTYERGYKIGTELTVSYERGGWLLYSNVALAQTKGRDINSSQGLFDSDELRYIATHYIHADYDQLVTISSGAAYRWNRFTWHTDLLSGSGMYGGFANSERMRTHCTINLGESYTFALSDKFSLAARLDVINAFDESYLLHEAGIGATVNQYGERRGFFLGISCDF